MAGYDYISPSSLRVFEHGAFPRDDAPALARSSKRVLQGSLLGGVSYGAAGTAAGIPSTPTTEATRDYHFGVTPQLAVALRLIAVTRRPADMTRADTT